MSSEADQIIDLYRRHADAWTKNRGQELIERKWIDKFVSRLTAEARILDIGCGSGTPIGRHFLDKGFALCGVDSSPELIAIAERNLKEGTWVVADMRDLVLGQKFDGLLVWNSFFHLTRDDQRQMFRIFEGHCAKGAILMFTSGPSHGEAIGTFEGEPLYHASLDGDEYRDLLESHGFRLVDHVREDPDCGGQTVWLASYDG